MSAGAAKNKSPKWSPLTKVNDNEEKRKRPKGLETGHPVLSFTPSLV
ncbi:hypothetical protein FOCG_17397 [Fusarium oxysporum f. sp. radicis-lycopersici 26381]|nr:hypothetical protein FOCG_17397 [Fusarium oxysporum f. sp. radicis-lycopersici 26381]